MTNAMEQAMKDAVSMAGGRIDREKFFISVQDIRAQDGQKVNMESIRSNTMKGFRLEGAGLTRVQIPQLGIDEIWDTETAENYLSGQGSGMTATFAGTDGLSTFTADYGTTQDVWFGIQRRQASDYPDAVAALIPTESTGYIEQNGELFKSAIAFTEKMAVMSEGPTGCGKTMAIKEFCYQTGLPLYRVNCRDGIDWEDLVGYMTADADGGTQFIDGMLTRAVRYGGIFYADEFNYARPAVMGGLNMVMDSKVLELPQTGEVIVAHPDFRVMSSFNPGYAGTNEINAATRSRFKVSLVFGYLGADLETQVIQSQSGVAEATIASELVAFANRVRDLKASHAIETDLSTRNLVATMTLLKHFNITEAMEMALLAQFGEDEQDEVRAVAKHSLTNFS